MGLGFRDEGSRAGCKRPLPSEPRKPFLQAADKPAVAKPKRVSYRMNDIILTAILYIYDISRFTTVLYKDYLTCYMLLLFIGLYYTSNDTILYGAVLYCTVRYCTVAIYSIGYNILCSRKPSI